MEDGEVTNGLINSDLLKGCIVTGWALDPITISEVNGPFASVERMGGCGNLWEGISKPGGKDDEANSGLRGTISTGLKDIEANLIPGHGG